MRKIKEKSGKPIYLFLFLFFTLLYSEAVVRIFLSGDILSFSPYFPFFAAAGAGIYGALCIAVGGNGGVAGAYVFTAAVTAFSAAQLVYCHIFDSYFSITQIGMGADAAASFAKELKIGISECAVPLVLLFVPLTVLIWLSSARTLLIKRRLKLAAVLMLASAVLHFATVFALPLSGTESYSPFDIYNQGFVLQMSERQFGIFTSLRLELQRVFFGGKTPKVSEIVAVSTTEHTGASAEPTAVPDVPPVVYEPNITDIDFERLMENETDSDTAELHKYFATQNGTLKNEYTGRFADYNLLVFCCESLSQYLIDEERTPTLCKMASEGFVFSNYYNTVCDNTSNGEYALCIGLLPDTSLLGKGWKTFYDFNSFTAAKRNLLPFCLGNQFLSDGATTYAVHNYNYDYYGRDKTHPAMGYKFLAMYRGLKKSTDWPTSDLSMMEQTLPLMLKQNEDGEINRFHAYYLTFSGHMSYNFSSNDMAIKNREVSDGLPYSTAVKAYISCQNELEAALTYTNEKLEEAGVADKTLIVITADHYPYNLGLDKLGELAEGELDSEFDKYKGPLIIWSKSMTEPVLVDTPCCTLDILPTVSNLLGLEFDSRLLMGSDIFSNGEHIAILGDRSFVTELATFNTANGEVTKLSDTLPEGYIDVVKAIVKNKFTVSTKMLYCDYYRKVYGSKAVTE